MVERLPEDARRFILTHIHAVTQLELLLDLHDRPKQEVSTEMVAREHRLGDEQADDLLHDLYARGFLARSTVEDRLRYRYQPESRELDRQVDAVAELYPKYRHSIIQLIFSRPGESVRRFAEAFRLRKDRNDG